MGMWKFTGAQARKEYPYLNEGSGEIKAKKLPDGSSK